MVFFRSPAHRVVEILGTIRRCRRQEPGDLHGMPAMKCVPVRGKKMAKMGRFMKNLGKDGEKSGEKKFHMSFEAEWQVSDKNKWDRHEVSQDDDATSAKVAWTPRFQQRMRNDHDMAHCYQRICNGGPYNYRSYHVLVGGWAPGKICQCQSSSHSLSGLRWKPCTPSSAVPGVDDDTPLATSLLWNEVA